MKLKELHKKYPYLVTWTSAALNLLYGMVLAFSAAVQQSYWYLTMAAYFLILGSARVMVSAFRKMDEKKTMKRLGLVFLFLAVVITGIIQLSITEGRNPSRTIYGALFQAVYAFALITIAVCNIIISHRRKDERMIMIRSISLASAIGSMLSLERVMLGTFGNADPDSIMKIEAYTGLLAFVLIVWLGISLLRRSRSIRSVSE